MSVDFETNRREFMKLGGQAFMMSLMLGSGMSGFTPVYAAETKVLDAGQAKLLTAVARTLFPHDMLDDKYYVAVVNAVDGKLAADAKLKSTVTDGLAKLPEGFAGMGEGERENALKAIEKSDFFGLMYNETLNGLYGNHDVWKVFGYEGSSVEHGGYIKRGFDEVSWLPKS